MAKEMVLIVRYWCGIFKRSLDAALLALAALLVALPLAASVPAQAADDVRPATRAADLTLLQVMRNEDALLLSAQLDFTLPLAVQSALTWGVPVYFIAEADIIHPRWYWANERLARARRYWRLSYLPLTRRWSLASSPEPLSEDGISTGLAQHYDSLDDAVTALQRITGWQIAAIGALADGGRQFLDFSFSLDTSQLPRALQIGATGQSDWRLHIERRIDLTQGVTP
ncbi:MAG: DUF4390 domain-containing protein [Burkholderiaceae bacterium]|nr:DUF4390 domain-containing protein [Burkholderiaceae bacterium]